DVVVVDLHEAELRPGLCHRDRRDRAGRAVRGEQRTVVDVDELVAVQRQDITTLPSLLRGELDAAAASEPLRLLGDDDLRAGAGEQVDELPTLTRGAREDHARHAGPRKAADLVGRERPTGD